MAQSAGLPFKITADSADAQAELKKFKKELDEIEKAEKDQATVLQRLGSAAGLSAQQFSLVSAGVTLLGSSLLATIGAGVGFFKLLYDLSKQSADWGSQIYDATQKTGLGAESISALKFSAEQAGSSFEQVTKGVTRFGITVGEAAQGSKEAAAGNSFNQQASGGSVGAGSGGEASNAQNQPLVFTELFNGFQRQNARIAELEERSNAVFGGVAFALDTFTSKFEAVSPGHVVMAGAQESPESIRGAVETELSSDLRASTNLFRLQGVYR